MTSTTMTTATMDYPTQVAFNEQVKEIYSQCNKDAAKQHQEAMIELRTHFEAKLERQESENIAALKGLRNDHEGELKNLKKDYEGELKNLKKDHEGELKQLKKDHEGELKTLKNDHKEELKQKDEESEHKDKKAKKDSEFIKEVTNVQKNHFNQWVKKNHQKCRDSGCDNSHVIDTLAKNVSKSNYMTGDIGEDTCRLLLLMGWTERTLCTECDHVQRTMPPVEVQGEIVREPATVDM